MDHSKELNCEPEPPTVVSDSLAPARGGGGRRAAVQDPMPDSESPGSSEVPTIIVDPLLTLAPSAHPGPTAVPRIQTPTRAARIPADTQEETPASAWGGSLLQPGTVLANRYEIVKTLGEGGMGAVYKALDLELEREIALKVIRPELANNPEILQRFKQELILARQITDRNVIRIFDLGEAGKIKFITMEYVEGESLYQLLRRQGKLEIPEAVDLMEQVASGLAAAHREGIIHRDLKPGNVMRDTHGRVVVMDFGLARSLDGDGMTRTGAMMGTIEYMSPEQAQGKELSASSDIFTAGLILYELLAGITPFHAESAVASLLKRTQERAVPLADIDKKIPGTLSNIVCKCLEKDPSRRYQSGEGLAAVLRTWQGKSGITRISATAAGLRMNRVRELPWRRIATFSGLMILLVAGIFLYMSRRPHTANVVAHAPVSVLVGDFQNNTGDTILDGTLEPMFNVALEGASFINAFNRGTAHKLAGSLPHPAQVLDEPTCRLVAVKEGIAAIVTGSLNKHGSGYSLTVNAVDAVTGKKLASAKINAANQDDLLLNIPKIAVPIRQALGDTTPKSVQLAAEQGALSTGNIEALHQYSIGMDQQFQGKWADALQSFSKAAQLDPEFARAYAGMAAAEGNLGQIQDAERDAKLAMEHVGRMTERERYRVRGLYYIWSQDWQNCVEDYSELLKQYPADNIAYSNLAGCYALMLDMPKAMEEARRGLQLTPNDIYARMNFALYSCYATDFQSCEQGARQVLALNPKYEKAFLGLAYAQIGQNQLAQAEKTYRSLETLNSVGASLAAAGLGDFALYQGRYREGAQILEKGAADDLAAGRRASAANKLATLQYADLLAGQNEAAAAAAVRALAHSQSAKIQFLSARTFAATGKVAKAQELAAHLGAQIQTTSQAYAKLILGEVALKAHNPNQAIQRFNEAKSLSDTWLGRFDLGRAYLEAGAFTEADSEFDVCIRRRGEALELFMDDVPTSSYLPLVYYEQGRDREGLNSPSFADSYRTYLDIRGQSAEDPVVSQIRHRLHQ